MESSASAGRVREAEAAFVGLAGGRRLALGIVLAGGGQAEDAPHLRGGLRPAVAHQGGVGERLQEIEGDRKQRRGKDAVRQPELGAFANHAVS